MMSYSFIISTAVYLYLTISHWNKYGAAEDALILFIYSRNLGNGLGITYNPTIGPVEGATAFGWMVYLGLGPILNVDILGLARVGSILFGIVIIWLISRWAYINGETTLSVLLPPLVVAVTYLPEHTLTGFSTVVFGGVYLITSFAALYLLKHPDSKRFQVIFIFSGVLFGIIRPEGAILTFSLIAGILFFSRKFRLSMILVLGTGIPFSVYHISRYLYFGYVFPNPFYIKSEGVAVVSNTYNAVSAFAMGNILLLILAAVGALALIDNHYSKIKEVSIFGIPVIAHFAIYSFITQAQNVDYRFQFIYIIFAAILLPFGINELYNIIQRVDIPARKTIQIGKIGVAFIIIVGLVFQPILGLGSVGFGSDPTNQEKEIGKLLSEYEDKNYTMIVNQAGAMPYYSGWSSIDAGGLNDPYIAHNSLDTSYIRHHDPDIIMFHAGSSATPLPPSCTTEGWDLGQGRVSERTAPTLHQYAVNNDYELGAIIRRGNSYDWYFVKNSNPYSNEIIGDMRSLSNEDYVEYNYNEYPQQFSCA